MKKLINFLIFLFLCYLAILIYRGNGVVDFNVVSADLLSYWNKLVGLITKH